MNDARARPGTPRVPGVRLARDFASMSIPEYSLYFWGMLAFFSGMNMMVVLRGYLVYDITDSELALALIMLSVALPMLVMAPIGGVIADRVDKRSADDLGAARRLRAQPHQHCADLHST